MNMDEYHDKYGKDPYQGLWGRISYLVLHRGVEAAIKEANSKDGVWQAATRMELRKRDKEIMSLSEVETEAWSIAISRASEYTKKKFVEAETDNDVLRKIMHLEVEKEDMDDSFLGLLNKRMQQNRGQDV